MGIGKMTYAGPSMNPTFQAGDMLFYEMDRRRPLEKGDVVIFKNKNRPEWIVHRVRLVFNGGIYTRGDNNGQADPGVLSAADILGRVVAIGRNGRKRPVRDGYGGYLYAKSLHGIRRLKSLLAPLYARIRIVSPFNGLAARLPACRVVAFDRPQGRELHLILKGRLIGRRPAGADGWRLVKPFDLLASEPMLSSLKEQPSDFK